MEDADECGTRLVIIAAATGISLALMCGCGRLHSLFKVCNLFYSFCDECSPHSSRIIGNNAREVFDAARLFAVVFALGTEK